MHAGVLHRFFDAFYVMLAPICPHLCEHVWGEVLGHGRGGAASVTRAPWPTAAAAAPDAALLLADDYLTSRIHAFRLTIAKLTVGKPGKTPKKEAAKASSARVYVAAGWPDWQRRPLQHLAGLWAPPAQGSGAGEGAWACADPVAAIKDLAMGDAALKPKLKNVRTASCAPSLTVYFLLLSRPTSPPPLPPLSLSADHAAGQPGGGRDEGAVHAVSHAGAADAF